MTFIVDLLAAILLLGLPLAVISWFLFSWLFSNGDLDREQDSQALRASIKKLKGTALAGGAERSKTRFLYDKWMWFGSGFYGLAGLWTFAVIEFTQFLGFMANASEWGSLLSGGVVSFVIEFAINQLGNMLQGLVWFTYWPAESILLWVLVAFLGYRLGLQWARQSIKLTLLSRWQDEHSRYLPVWVQKVMRRLIARAAESEDRHSEP